jgi:hypothetical protein
VLLRRQKGPPPDPDEVMVGRCPACKAGVECPRRLATPPADHRFLARPPGVWDDTWRVACPACGGAVGLMPKAAHPRS